MEDHMPRMTLDRGDKIGLHIDYDGNNKVFTIRPYFGPYDAAFRITLEELKVGLGVSDVVLPRSKKTRSDDDRVQGSPS
jgi:hypothetical protein